jgi:hypothetical protein
MSQPVSDSAEAPKLPPVTDEAAEAARDQLAEYYSFAKSDVIPAGGELFEIPNPSLLSEDQQERYDVVQHQLRRFAHETIVIRNMITNEVVVDPKTGEPLTNRVLIEPHETTDGELVTPPYWSRVLKAVIGDDDYARFIAKGGRPNQFRLVWSKMQREMLERQAEDSKSKGSA